MASFGNEIVVPDTRSRHDSAEALLRSFLPGGKSRLLLTVVAVLMVTACDRTHNSLAETPYAARFAVSKPAYVRTSAKAAAPTATETFIDPQFTAAQALAGAEVYRAVCARCHASTQWTGGTFAASWQDRRLLDFYDLVSATMPQDNPGGLTTDQYVNATAHVLELAGFANGDVALRADTAMLRHARLTMKKTVTPDSAVATPARAPGRS